MKAIIITGEEDSGFIPLTYDIPKSMLPVLNKPLIQHSVELLKANGVTQIGIIHEHMPYEIINFLANGSDQGVNIHYFDENSSQISEDIREFLDESFIVINECTLISSCLFSAIRFHKSRGSLATLLLSEMDNVCRHTAVLIDENYLVTGVVERPNWYELPHVMASTGIYILEPEVLKYINSRGISSFMRYLPVILQKYSVPMLGYILPGYWCNINDLRSYTQAHYDILEGKISLNINARKIRKNVWVGPGTLIERNAEINGPCFIGSNCIIGNGTVIEDFCILGDNNIIADEVSLKKTILWNRCCIDYGSEVRGSIICNSVNIGHYVSIFENSVVGNNCTINERVIVKPKILIWPGNTVNCLSVVDRNMVLYT